MNYIKFLNTKIYEWIPRNTKWKTEHLTQKRGVGVLFYYDTLKQLLSDQQFFTPLLTLCMPFWQVLLFLHMIKETKKNIDN